MNSAVKSRQEAEGSDVSWRDLTAAGQTTWSDPRFIENRCAGWVRRGTADNPPGDFSGLHENFCSIARLMRLSRSPGDRAMLAFGEL